MKVYIQRKSTGDMLAHENATAAQVEGETYTVVKHSGKEQFLYRYPLRDLHRIVEVRPIEEGED